VLAARGYCPASKILVMSMDPRPALEWRQAGTSPPPLDHETLQVWRVHIGARQPSAVMADRRAMLSPDEIARAGRFRHPAHGDRFVLCRGALRHILSLYLGTPPGAIAFVCGRSGKPALGPEIPAISGIVPAFNVSHAGDIALVALTAGCAIGIDVEEVRAMPDADQLVERFFSAGERIEYRSLPSEARPLAFFHGWTRKEAFVKALGEGLSRPLQTFQVTLAPREPARILAIDGHPGEEHDWSLHAFEPAPGYTAAVAARLRDPVLTFFDFRD